MPLNHENGAAQCSYSVSNGNILFIPVGFKFRTLFQNILKTFAKDLEEFLNSDIIDCYL